MSSEANQKPLGENEPLTAPKTRVVDISEIGAPLAGAMPEPTEGILPEATPVNQPLTDKRGKTFDASRHKTNADGSPAVDRNGYFYSANLGRPSNEKKADKTVRPTSQPPPAVNRPAPVFASLPGGLQGQPGEVLPAGPLVDPHRVTAEGYFGLGHAAVVGLFGEESAFNEMEKGLVMEPLTDMCRELKAEKLSWKVALPVSIFGIMAMKVQTKPTVKERWESLKKKVMSWISPDKKKPSEKT